MKSSFLAPQHPFLQVVGDDGRHRMSTSPLGDAHSWSLSLTGEIERPCTLSMAELWRLGRESHPFNITCVSSGKIYRPKGQNATFSGLSLSALLDSVGLKRDASGAPIAQTVRFVSRAPGACGPIHERHHTSLPLEDCLQPGQILIADLLDGQPLSYGNGGPLRSIARDFYFYKSIKWLDNIELSTLPMDEMRGTWERYAGYHNLGRTGEERFEAFLQVCDRKGVPELLIYESETPDAAVQMREIFATHLASGDLSRVSVAKLEQFVPDFEQLPGWDANLRFSGNADESGVPTLRAALRGCRLNQLDFRGWDLSYANFSLARFVGATFSNEDGSAAASLHHCDFEGACFWSARLRGVDMRGAYLGGASFYKPQGTGEAEVEGLLLDGAKGLDEETAQWLTQHGAVGAKSG